MRLKIFILKYTRKKQSLSELVENYSRLTTGNRKKVKPKQLSEKVRKLRGIIDTDDNFDYKHVLTEELSKKYGV